MSNYEPFSMCPFAMASVGGGGSVGGIGAESYTWTHVQCLERACVLWQFKIDESGEQYAEGCALQFLGSSRAEIAINIDFRQGLLNNKLEAQRAEEERKTQGKFCLSCKHFNQSWRTGLTCSLSQETVEVDHYCNNYSQE